MSSKRRQRPRQAYQGSFKACNIRATSQLRALMPLPRRFVPDQADGRLADVYFWPGADVRDNTVMRLNGLRSIERGTNGMLLSLA